MWTRAWRREENYETKSILIVVFGWIRELINDVYSHQKLSTNNKNKIKITTPQIHEQNKAN